MDILLISESKKLKELLSFQLSSQLPVNVRECASSKEGGEFLSRKERICDLVIAPFTGPEAPILQVMRDTKPFLPIIFYFDPMIAEPTQDLFSGMTFLGLVDVSTLVEGTLTLVKEFMGKSGLAQDPFDYCPIRTSLLLMVNPLKSDIFIRLSLQKFVKVFNAGSEFGQDDLSKYDSREVEYLYVKRAETGDFVQKFRGELDTLLAKADLKPQEAMDVVVQTQEAIQELIGRIGFSEEVQELAKQNVQLTLKAIGKNPQLKDLIDRVQTSANYISYHSAVLAEVSCSLAKVMEWSSESSFSKLVLASLMHDVAVSNPELAKMSSMEELDANRARFQPNEIRDYLLHTIKAADVIRSFKEIPADVDTIVLQHHERPDGTGFPRKVSGPQISPLGALFIVSHDLAREIVMKGKAFDMPAFVVDRSSRYPSGNFKKLLTALSKLY